MKVRVLGAYGGTLPGCRMTCFLIDGEVVVDAGSLASSMSLDDQCRVKHVVLSHSHWDHINSLPFFIENVFGRLTEPVRIHSLPAAIDTVQRHLFNNAVWPDFASIPDRVLPMMEFKPAPTQARIDVGSLAVTMIPVNHTVPTVGLLIEDADGAIVVSGDTAPTHALWSAANALGNVKAIFLECSFPNRMQQLADVSKHLTPQQLPAEIAKCQHECPVYVYHIKPPYKDEVIGELTALGHPRLHVAEQDRTYDF